LVERFPSLSCNTVVVHGCVDTEKFTPGPPREALRESLDIRGGPVLLTVSRLATGRSKGHDTVMRALALLDAEVSYVVAGDGPDRPRLETRARELGVAERVRF